MRDYAIYRIDQIPINSWIEIQDGKNKEKDYAKVVGLIPSENAVIVKNLSGLKYGVWLHQIDTIIKDENQICSLEQNYLGKYF